MNILHVACAIIERDGRVLAAQRSEVMSLPLKWEFPGGKIKEGESPAECLKREVLEELGVDIAVNDPLPPATHSYPAFTVTLYPFRCVLVKGEIVLHEHKAVVWVRPEKMHTLDWAEADWPVIQTYIGKIK